MILAPTLTLSAGSGAAIVRPTFSRDFAGEKSLNNGTGPAITFARASNATFFNASGVLQTAANDVPRFDHDPATGASRGLLIEEARTNSIRNSQAGGATVGVIGSGGVMPTNWFVGGGSTSNGVSTEVVGTGTESGLAYIDIKISGTPTASANANNFTDPTNTAAATSGQTWTASYYVKLQAGSLTNATVSLVLETRDSSNVFVADGTTTAITPTSADLRTQRYSATDAFAAAGVAFASTHLRVAYTSGDPIDLTLRIAAPQLEQGAFPTSYIPTTAAAATRSADSAFVTPISSFYNQAEGTLFAEFQATTLTELSTRSRRIARFDDNTQTSANIEINQNGTNNQLRALGIISSAVQWDFTQGSAITSPTKTAVAFAQNSVNAATNGTLGTEDTSATVPSGLTHLRLGRSEATQQLQGYLRKIAYWPKRLSNTLLQQLTT